MYLIYNVACNFQYVGCTTRALRTRVGEHYCYTVNTNARHIHNILRHFRECHASDRTWAYIYENYLFFSYFFVSLSLSPGHVVLLVHHRYFFFRILYVFY